MPCFNADGTMEPVARAILHVLRSPRKPEEVAQQVLMPLYRIRSGLRELVQAELAEERDGAYALTPSGRSRLEAAG